MASVRYSITLTLKPVLYQKIAERQYDETYVTVAQITNKFPCKLTLVAELTKQGMNIHYHGTIQFLHCYKNNKKTFIDTFRGHKQIGYICIKEITDEPGWIDYIKKDIPDTKYYIDRRPILKDDFDYFSPDDYANYGTEW